MTLYIHSSSLGPYVVCDQCKAKLNLPHNCGWGQKFIKPSLAKLGMPLKPPHVCKNCRESEVAV